MRSKIFSTAENLRYAKREFYVFHNVSASCLSQAINFQLLSLLFCRLPRGPAAKKMRRLLLEAILQTYILEIWTKGGLFEHNY